MTFWGVVAFGFQAVLIFALSTVLFDGLHWLLHRWGKSKFPLFRMFARWHWVHHSFLDRRLRVHPDIAGKNSIFNVVPAYVTSAMGTLLFLFCLLVATNPRRTGRTDMARSENTPRN